jgi:hypothetical protein
MENLRGLSCVIRMWPPQDHVNTIASKWELTRTLDFIAQERTKTARPKTRLLVDGETIRDAMVLKRTHSDAGEHVLMPTHVVKRNWDYLRSQLDVPRSRWMAQSYVETLVKLGEWRSFVIGGRIVYTVYTLRNREKGTWSWDMARTYYTLEELTWVIFFCAQIILLTIRQRNAQTGYPSRDRSLQADPGKYVDASVRQKPIPNICEGHIR